MKTAIQQNGILLPEIREITLTAPPGRKLWREILRVVFYVALEAPRLVRERAPNERPLEEYEWRPVRYQRWIA